MTLTREETIERLKQNKAAAEFYAGQSRITAEIENALKDSEAFDMAIEALSAEEAVWNEYEAEFTNLPDIPRYYYEKVVGKMAHEINMLKEQLESAEAGWIPCSERLPEKGEVVLITNGKGNVRCGQYRSEHDVRDGAHYWWWKGKTVETVLAWMPLPEPYREDGEV